MKTTVQHPKFGEIVYDENLLTGKRAISVGGYALQKRNKTTYVVPGGPAEAVVYVKGNFFSGVSLSIMGQDVRVTASTKWYEYVLSALIFALILIWGNSTALCAILPVVGGAIGGGISGLMLCVNLLLMKSTNKLWLKLLIWLGMIIATVLICHVIALAFLSVLM